MNIKLTAIERDTTIQCRASIDVATVNDYAERMTEGDEFPPVVLFATNGKHWVGDGWHRLLAAEHIGALTIPAEIRKGGRVEALKHALGANAAHGHRRTNADKRRCVEIALREFPKLSSRAVAEMCGVGRDLVDRARQVADSATSATEACEQYGPAFIAATEAGKRTGADGKQYPAKRGASCSVGMIDEDEPERDEPKGKETLAPPCNGMHFANIALINLKQIRSDDIERDAAFSMIRRFIDDKQTAAH